MEGFWPEFQAHGRFMKYSMSIGHDMWEGRMRVFSISSGVLICGWSGNGFVTTLVATIYVIIFFFLLPLFLAKIDNYCGWLRYTKFYSIQPANHTNPIPSTHPSLEITNQAWWRSVCACVCLSPHPLGLVHSLWRFLGPQLGLFSLIWTDSYREWYCTPNRNFCTILVQRKILGLQNFTS